MEHDKCDDTLNRITDEVVKVFEHEEEPETAIAAIDEIIGETRGEEPVEGTPTAKMLAWARAMHTPPDGGPDDEEPSSGVLAAGGD